jgi:subtilisin family serine protease
MDPELWELYEGGDPDDEVNVILRLAPGAEPPPTVRVVCRFDGVATARILRGNIVAARQSAGVISLKASGLVSLPSPLEEGESEDDETVEAAPVPSLAPVGEDGRGVLVGICDWGFDFTHPNFRNADGSTRLEALWDQRGSGDPTAPAPYDYGRLMDRAAINEALAQPDPCAALGYHPADGDPTDTGAHGTHVADILAGNRREPGSQVGLASGSDIVFVHLGSQRLSELADLGDSVGLLEGLDFIRRQAAGRPCVLHLSAGKTGGPHLGTTLLERAVDSMLQQPGIVLVQSVGNYADAAMHTHARIGPDQSHSFDWVTPANDRTPNELEIWYSGEDVFEIRLQSPDGREFGAQLDSRLRLDVGGAVWGNLYHRLREPNCGLNHIAIYLYPSAPSGRWRVTVRGREVVDGRMHAWIERDATGRYQSRFPRAQATSLYTTNTICNCFRAIAVGAYDSAQPKRPPTRFSSRGPTADGRQKPEVSAPGFRIRAARSLPRDGWRGERKLTVKSGTSMAAPWVSGTVALMMAAAARPLTIHEIRRALIGAVDPHPGPAGRTSTRLGYGYLNTAAAVAAARKLGQQAPPASATREDLEADDAGWAPVWVEDAAAGALGDEGAPDDVEDVAPEPAEPPVLALREAAPGGCGCGQRPAPVTEGCGCGGTRPAPPSEDCGCGGHAEGAVEAEAVGEDSEDEDWEDEDWEDEDEADGEPLVPFGAAGASVDTPFAWEELQEALADLEERGA